MAIPSPASTRAICVSTRFTTMAAARARRPAQMPVDELLPHSDRWDRNQPLAFQGGPGGRCSARRRFAIRAYDHQIKAKKGCAPDSWRVPGPAQSDIERACFHPLKDGLKISVEQLNSHIRPSQAELFDCLGQNATCEQRRCTDGYGVARRFYSSIDPCHRVFELFESSRDHRRGFGPIRPEFDVPGGPVKQTKSELMFQLSYQKTQSRWRDEERLCGTAEIVMLSDQQESPKLSGGKLDHEDFPNTIIH